MKILLTFLFFLSMQLSMYAQFNIQWQNTIGGNDFDLVRAVVQTSDGGYICGAMSRSDISGDKTENSNGSTDCWIVKLNDSGYIEWQNTIGGSAQENLMSIAQTMDGGYICGGSSDSDISGDKTENSNGLHDYWVVKLDSIGQIQWQNTIGGSNYDELQAVFQTSDGGYICGGESQSDISGDKSENSHGSYDYWIVKLDATGNIQWENTIGGSLVDKFTSIRQTIDGGYICCGFSNSNISADKTENSNGGYDYWVIKLDSSGGIEWQNTIGGISGEQMYTVIQTNDGGYICGGFSNSDISGDKTENSQGLYDYWIVKLDAAGNIQWESTIGGSIDDLLTSVTQTSDGNYLCSGQSNSNISGDKVENSFGEMDYWLVALDLSGNILWQNTIGGNSLDNLYSPVPETTDGAYIIAGSSESILSGDKTENCQGEEDFWIVKLSGYHNLIKGKTFADSNSNSLYDPGEPLLQGITITNAQSGESGISYINGEFNIAIADSGLFSIFPSYLYHYTAAPVSHNAYFSSLQQTDSLNDFGFLPNGVINDLRISITPLTPFRPGFDAYYNLHYQNVGTTSLTGTIIFYTDSQVTYLNSTITPTLVTADSIVWQTSMLNPFDAGDIIVTVNVIAGTLNGNLVNSSAKIEPVSGDALPNNNQDSWEVIVTGSYDPNDILVNRATIETDELLIPPFLEYIIRFQNTGTDTAFTVKALNPIDTVMLQLNTFELISSSHPLNITWKAWERNMEFQLDNILLPDSGSNEPLSHGFIRYRIKPKATLSAGDTIKNKAYIYFDFNTPVATNIAETAIILPTLISLNVLTFDFIIFPNPTDGNSTISLMLNQPSQVQLHIYNALGQIVAIANETFSSGKKELNIPTNKLPKGIYSVKVTINGNAALKKMVKM